MAEKKTATCIDNTHVEDELTVGKDYEFLPDEAIMEHNLTDYIVTNDKGEGGRYFSHRFKNKDNENN